MFWHQFFTESPLTCNRLIILPRKSSLQKSPTATTLLSISSFMVSYLVMTHWILGRYLHLPFKAKDKPIYISTKYRFTLTENHHIIKTSYLRYICFYFVSDSCSFGNLLRMCVKNKLVFTAWSCQHDPQLKP